MRARLHLVLSGEIGGQVGCGRALAERAARRRRVVRIFAAVERRPRRRGRRLRDEIVDGLIGVGRLGALTRHGGGSGWRLGEREGEKGGGVAQRTEARRTTTTTVEANGTAVDGATRRGEAMQTEGEGSATRERRAEWGGEGTVVAQPFLFFFVCGRFFFFFSRISHPAALHHDGHHAATTRCSSCLCFVFFSCCA